MFTRLLLVLLGLISANSAWSATVTPLGNGNAIVETSGEAGNLVTIEALDDIARQNWEKISSVLLRTNRLQWVDPWCGTGPNRFYRIRQAKFAELPPNRADNFRLLDHAGKSHELYYFWNDERVNAFVLIFTANGCSEVINQLPVIRALQQKYENQGVKFWMINSNTNDTRASIAAEAARLGLTFPILQDRAQTVARLYGASRAAEVVCISRANFQVFYRGAFDERITATAGTAARNFVDEALTEYFAGEEVTLRETKAAGCDVPVVSSSDLSYSRDVAPILQAKCVTCHSPGNIAPWSMTNHAIVQIYAPSIREQVSTRKMPPWHADSEHGRFRNDMSLTADEEQTLIQWVTDGARRGEGSDPLEAVPLPPPRWPLELGEPDLILRPPLQQIDASGVEPYRYIFVQSGLTNDTWVRAAIVRPSNTRVVHHYLVWEGQSMSQMASGLAAYVPGMQMASLPEGTGLLFKKDMWLTFNLHYTPTSQPETDQPELALWFHKSPPAKTFKTLPLLNQGFTIPAGANEYEVRAELPIPLPFPVTIHGLSAHMHFRGARMKFEIIDPSGKRETLLSVPRYRFQWQTTYQLEQPRRIPQGYRIVVTGAFDNSEQNMQNPDPGETVRWGDQSFEEMFIGYFDYTDG
jgi:peroxiredoxin